MCASCRPGQLLPGHGLAFVQQTHAWMVLCWCRQHAVTDLHLLQVPKADREAGKDGQGQEDHPNKVLVDSTTGLWTSRPFEHSLLCSLSACPRCKLGWDSETLSKSCVLPVSVFEGQAGMVAWWPQMRVTLWLSVIGCL